VGTIDSAADRSPSLPAAVVVAAYNEADRIAATLRALALAFPGSPLWVADDGSRDATATIAAGLGAHVVSSGRVVGKGSAVTAAAQALLRERGRCAVDGERPVFVLCDGDLGESARELGALADAVADGATDVAVAAFATRVGGGVGVALGFARWAIRRRCGMRAGAPISGQRALTEQALRDALPFAAGYGMEVGMTIDAVRAGHRVSEVEVDLAHRATGRTLRGFAHRGRQLLDFVRVYLARR
jgi:glycosyltransferase involved in cell wall biosynthesis